MVSAVVGPLLWWVLVLASLVIGTTAALTGQLKTRTDKAQYEEALITAESRYEVVNTLVLKEFGNPHLSAATGEHALSAVKKMQEARTCLNAGDLEEASKRMTAAEHDLRLIERSESASRVEAIKYERMSRTTRIQGDTAGTE